MADHSLRIIKYFVIVISLFFYSAYHSQVNGQDTLRINAVIDTSDYIPVIFEGALDYNLMIAASKGYTSEITRLINKGADVDAETGQGATPLIFAIANNQTEAVRTLLNFNPDINKITSNSETPLLVAVKSDNLSIAEMLIRAGADINYADRHNATALHYSSLYDYLKMSDMLLYYNADINATSWEGITPLMASVEAGNTDITDLLVQRGANTEISNDDGYTPFLMSSYYGDTISMYILYKHGANIYARNKSGLNALSLAVINDQKQSLDFLFNTGFNTSLKEMNVINLYDLAARYQRKDMIGLLKEHNVPGQMKYRINQASLSLSGRASVHDMFTGMSLSFREPYLNSGFILGLDTKLWYTRVLVKNAENVFYQYMSKESLVYGGIFKDFPLTKNTEKMNFAVSSSLCAGYTFGSSLKGTTKTFDSKLKIIPSAGVRISKTNLSFNLDLEYIKSDFYHAGPVWLRFGLSYNYFFDKIRAKIKPIRWN
jgi:ankyrin repeat protein